MVALRGAGLSFAKSTNTTNTTASGSIAMPNIAGHPKRSASRGAKSVASSVPELPAPAMPIASP